jgi:hypothetical protein
LLQAQSQNYEDLWAKVENLEIEGLHKSALKIIDDISARAKKDKNTPQSIKTMLYKSKYALVLEEDSQLNIINDFKTKIAESDFPTKNILENILANLYWQYFNQHRWQSYSRTETSEKVDTEDFRTWDLQTLFNEIDTYFQKSLQNGLMLQQEALKKYDVLLDEQKDSKVYRPTLYDFLSHNALEFYKTNETHITKPAYKFTIDNPEFLTDAESFSTLNIKTRDTTSLQLQALNIYQDLIQFHLKNKSPYALADVNIERLKFVKQHATFPNKQNIFLNTLNAESENHKTHTVSGLYDFEMASMYFQQSQSYQPKTNETNRWKAKEALKLCHQIISKFPKGKGAEKSAVLKSQIEQLLLQIVPRHFYPFSKMPDYWYVIKILIA